MEKKSPASGTKNPLKFPWVYLILLAVLPLAFTLRLPKEREKKPSNQNSDARKPAVAGTFYPADKATLTQLVDDLLREANPPEIKGTIRAIIVPHAGYTYSGPVAAMAYKILKNRDVRTVVLMSNCHSEGFDGISVYSKGAFETPLGSVPIDTVLAEKLIAANPKIMNRPSAHLQEHTLEVQLPFIQRVMKDFKIVPIEFGSDSPELTRILADALRKNIDDKTLIIASTDMSHYPPYEAAKTSDRETINAILSGKAQDLDATLAALESKDVPNAQTFLCGVSAVRTVLLLSETLNPIDIRLLKYSNSGDTSGDRNRVVGYSAIVFTTSLTATQSVPETPPTQSSPAQSKRISSTGEEMLNTAEQEELLSVARVTVENYVLNRKVPAYTPTSAKLQEKLGAFVTLKTNGHLRGCIGQFEPAEPLYRVVQQVGIAAAMQDPRFHPVSMDELEKIDYEISVLSPLRKVASANEIEMEKHGVQVSRGFNSGVFLPQVATETGWNKETFLSELCSQKAGLPSDCWKDPKVNLYVFTAQVFSEEKK